jgi:hypothetical protein
LGGPAKRVCHWFVVAFNVDWTSVVSPFRFSEVYGAIGMRRRMLGGLLEILRSSYIEYDGLLPSVWLIISWWFWIESCDSIYGLSLGWHFVSSL